MHQCWIEDDGNAVKSGEQRHLYLILKVALEQRGDGVYRKIIGCGLRELWRTGTEKLGNEIKWDVEDPHEYDLASYLQSYVKVLRGSRAGREDA